MRDQRTLRELIAISNEVIQRAYDNSDATEPDELFQQLENRIIAAKSSLQLRGRLPSLCDAATLAGDNLPEVPPEIVKDLLHQGSKLVLGGSSKAFKTWALLDLAISVATGTPWWGFPCKKGRVCYLNFEIQEFAFFRRKDDIVRAKGVALNPKDLMVWNLRGYCAAIEDLIDEFLPVLRAGQFSLIIFDPIYKSLGHRDENKAGDIASLCNVLERIAVKSNRRLRSNHKRR